MRGEPYLDSLSPSFASIKYELTFKTYHIRFFSNEAKEGNYDEGVVVPSRAFSAAKLLYPHFLMEAPTGQYSFQPLELETKPLLKPIESYNDAAPPSSNADHISRHSSVNSFQRRGSMDNVLVNCLNMYWGVCADQLLLHYPLQGPITQWLAFTQFLLC